MVMGEAAVDPKTEEFERRGLESTLGVIVRARLAMMVVLIAFAGWLAYADPAWWRRLLLLALMLILVALDVGTRQRFIRHGFEPMSVRLNLATMAVMQAVMVFATGGLASPILPLMVPASFAASLLIGPSRLRGLVFVVQLSAIALFVVLHFTNVLPSLVPVPLRVPRGPVSVTLVVLGASMAVLITIFGVMGRHLRITATGHLGRLAVTQNAVLSTHRQRLDELTTLCAEIAHELKNPLASVKGLSQLLARGVRSDDVKTADRLAVLQREVTRMQSILDEFLNFSRPLTPLNRTEIDVAALCQELIALHEAMAAERGVHLRMEVQPQVRLHGDDRKIGQVLINLLQNALEAAPSGTVVELSGRREGETILLRVRDHGAGLDPQLRSRVFEPGVTSKRTGNGLGLTIARAIAEQHGGQLRLETPTDGGCRAVLAVPVRAPAVEGS